VPATMPLEISRERLYRLDAQSAKFWRLVYAKISIS